MTPRDRLRGLLAGLGAGSASGLFGVGGGLALIPVLTGFFKFTQHQAHGTSLAVIGFTALAALGVYGAHANVVWVAAAPMALGSLVTARIGARIAARVSPDRLRRTFALFLMLVALRLFWQPPEISHAAGLPGIGGTLGYLALGLAAGLLAGFMGVGGGILVVPVLTLVFGMSQQAAQGTSLAVMLVTAPSAALEHSRHGNVMWRMVPILAVGAALGAPLAAWGAQGLPHAWLTRGFALFLAATGAHTWFRADGARRSRPSGSAAGESS